MTSPSTHRTVRWFGIGAALGLMISGLLVGSWHQSASGLSVTVLGAGRQASVLITFDHRYVLLAAGTNGAAFSNALSEALPPVGRELELVLIDPDASPDVQERVRALKSRLVWMLPAPSEPPSTKTIKRSFIVDFDEATQLWVSIGAGGSWQAELTSTAGHIVMGRDVAAIQSARQMAVAIFTHEQSGASVEVPLIIGVPGTTAPTGRELRVAGPGSTIRLDLDNGEIRTDAA